MAILQIYRDETPVIQYRLPVGRTVVGRADNCDIALPDEQVSRTHCLLERSVSGELVVVDRSRHGTLVNGHKVSRATLQHGDRLGVGAFVLEILLRVDDGARVLTAPLVKDLSHEPILGGGVDGMEVVRLTLRILSGPDAGRDVSIPSPDVSVGGPGSQVEVADPDLLPRHFRLLVNHGRPLVLPEAGAVTVDLQRVRGAFPLYPGEAFHAGSTRFQVVPTADAERPESAQFHEMQGDSQAMRRVFGMLRRVAASHETVLLLGESGTGKELAARGLHEVGQRAGGPFLAVNCGAIPENLFESELFGHEKGAFTGAVVRRDGAFHHAHGGTLFLDEVGEIPLASQAKLLRALESGEVRRVGSNVPTFPDVRVVAATNRDLAREVGAGRFREDLFFRLAVLTIRLPPLRERPEDVDALARAFIVQLGPEAVLTPEALQVLRTHAWPGNVRELRNVLTRAWVLHGPVIGPSALTFTPVGPPPGDLAADRYYLSEDGERDLCRAALDRHQGNRTAAARELGLPRTTFLYKLRRLGLEG